MADELFAAGPVRLFASRSDGMYQHPYCLYCHFRQRLPDRGDLRPKRASGMTVIEAHHGQRPGQVQPPVIGRCSGTGSHVAAAGKDRRGRVRGVQQPLGRFHTGPIGAIALFHRDPTGVDSAIAHCGGKPAPALIARAAAGVSSYGSQWSIYRSTDGSSSWIQINHASHQWGGTTVICGDMRTFGTVYLGTAGGRGIVWGTSPQ